MASSRPLHPRTGQGGNGTSLAPARRAVVFSGHMTDAPGRRQPRFPPGQEPEVKARLAQVLQEWNVGPSDLALCGGARGGDLLFAELCLTRGATVRLLIPLSEDEFVRRSVHLDGTDWTARYRAVRERCDAWFQPERLGPLPPRQTEFERNNDWLIETAQAEAGTGEVIAIVVWDGQDNPDQPGGTADFAAGVASRGFPLVIVDPAGAKIGRMR